MALSSETRSVLSLSLAKKVVWSWHLLSAISLIVAVFHSPVVSTNIDGSSGSSTLGDVNAASVTDMSTSTADPQPSNSNSSKEEVEEPQAADCAADISEACSSSKECKDLGGYCLDCVFNSTCHYGTKQMAKCKPKQNVNCSGDQTFEREYECRYCYQLPESEVVCNQSTTCALNKPQKYYPAHPQFISTCWARPETLCLGRRCFHKQFPCNWSQGYKWSTAMLLSIFLGGFGADRFYLGLWKEGIGKLLSFGGLGVWTLVDVILIGVGYIGPYDGSVYL
ncbi:TM2 domain-containing protein 3 [Aplysia californica]|uniref:TM2 domain-containing protein 3 n=1 Tax=Aplysia californica TaxID=6500 RepID=A0ABM0JIG5_APLCA|nr:TM2 domain-containing protein 3 [Aplysia californica]